jgi:hypothetical protein
LLPLEATLSRETADRSSAAPAGSIDDTKFVNKKSEVNGEKKSRRPGRRPAGAT